DQEPPEQDRRQRQEAQRYRSDTDIAGNPTVAQQLAEDQSQTERLIFVTDPVIAFEKDHLARPGGRKPRLVQYQRQIRAGVRILQHDIRQRAGNIDPAQHMALPLRSNTRAGNVFDSLPRSAQARRATVAFSPEAAAIFSSSASDGPFASIR